MPKWVVGVMCVVAVLGVPTSARAQDPPAPKKSDAGINRATVVAAVASVADSITTLRVFSISGLEGNGLIYTAKERNRTLSWLEHKPKTMIAFGTALDIGGALVWRRLTRNHRKIGAAGLYVWAAYVGYAAVQNERGRQHALRMLGPNAVRR